METATQSTQHYLEILTLVAGWIISVLVGLYGAVVLYQIFTGKIDLSKLLNEPGGGASLSRFQFLIFTLVIAMSLFLVIVSKEGGPGFPEEIPAGILGLLGISGGSYAVSKGIQAKRDSDLKALGVNPGK
jgi:hypothetical protein